MGSLEAEISRRERPTDQVALHSLPPYLRAAAMACIRADERLELGDWGSVVLSEPRGDQPSYLVAWRRDAWLAADPDPETLAQALEEFIAVGGLRRRVADLFELVVLLGAWDDAIREVGLYPGRAYLASEEATGRLFRFAGEQTPDPDSLRELLIEAQSLELIYRFPVAYKFRRAYGRENQCRLNGWGRRLARRTVRDRESARLRERWYANLRAHLLDCFDDYSSHIEYVGSEGLATAPADSFALAARLPVPILL